MYRQESSSLEGVSVFLTAEGGGGGNGEERDGEWKEDE